MPALDDCSPQVVRALQKADWDVGAKPERKRLKKRLAYIDLVARHKQHAAYIEVKCFPIKAANSQEEYTAIGQYIIYRATLELLKDPTPLYLALPRTIYERLDEVMRKVLADYEIKLLIFDAEREEILEWIG